MILHSKSKTRLSVLILLSFLFANSAQAVEFMNANEMAATFPGNTVTGISNRDGKTRWIQAYGKGKRKGKIAGNFGGEQYKAEWRIRNGEWCEDWGEGQYCWKFERIGEKQFRIYINGEPKKHLWTLK